MTHSQFRGRPARRVCASGSRLAIAWVLLPIALCACPASEPQQPEETLTLADCTQSSDPSECCIPNLYSPGADHSAAFQECLDRASMAASPTTVVIPACTRIVTSRPLFLWGQASLRGDDRDRSVIELAGGCFDLEALGFKDVLAQVQDETVPGTCGGGVNIGKSCTLEASAAITRAECPPGPASVVTCGRFVSVSPNEFFQPYWIHLGHRGAKTDTLSANADLRYAQPGQELLIRSPGDDIRWSGRLENLTLRLTKTAEPNLANVIHLHFANRFTIQGIVVDQRPVGQLGNNTIGATGPNSRWSTDGKSRGHEQWLDTRRQQIVGGTIVNNLILAENTGREIDVMPDDFVAYRQQHIGETFNGTNWKRWKSRDPRLADVEPEVRASLVDDAWQSLHNDWCDLARRCSDPAGYIQLNRLVDPALCPEANTVGVVSGCKLRRNLGGAAGINATYFNGGCDGKGEGVLAGKQCNSAAECGNDQSGKCDPTWVIAGNCFDGISDDGISMKGSRGGVVLKNTVRAIRGHIDTTALGHFGSREIVFEANYLERIRGALDGEWYPALGGTLSFHATEESPTSGVNSEVDFACNFGYMPGKQGRCRPTDNRASGRFAVFRNLDGSEILDNLFVDDTVETGECDEPGSYGGKPCSLDSECVSRHGTGLQCIGTRQCTASSDYCMWDAPGCECRLDPSIELEPSGPYYLGRHPQCLGRCTGEALFFACEDAGDCASGTCEHREPCNDFGDACSVSLLGGYPSDKCYPPDPCPLHQCRLDLLSGSPGTPVRVEGNILTGRSIRCDDPIVATEAELESLLTNVKFGDVNFSSPEASQIMQWVEIGDVKACAPPSTIQPQDNLVEADRSLANSLVQWRERCPEIDLDGFLQRRDLNDAVPPHPNSAASGTLDGIRTRITCPQPFPWKGPYESAQGPTCEPPEPERVSVDLFDQVTDTSALHSIRDGGGLFNDFNVHGHADKAARAVVSAGNEYRVGDHLRLLDEAQPSETAAISLDPDIRVDVDLNLVKNQSDFADRAAAALFVLNPSPNGTYRLRVLLYDDVPNDLSLPSVVLYDWEFPVRAVDLNSFHFADRAAFVRIERGPGYKDGDRIVIRDEPGGLASHILEPGDYDLNLVSSAGGDWADRVAELEFILQCAVTQGSCTNAAFCVNKCPPTDCQGNPLDRGTTRCETVNRRRACVCEYLAP